MRKIIPFKKEILFKTKLKEVTSISLEHDYRIKDDVISGEFIVSGDYKITASSVNREKFNYTIPFEIAIDSRYDIKTINLDIENFYYEIINDEILKVNIDVYVEGEYKKVEELAKEIPKDIKKEETDNSKIIIDDISDDRESDKEEVIIDDSREGRIKENIEVNKDVDEKKDEVVSSDVREDVSRKGSETNIKNPTINNNENINIEVNDNLGNVNIDNSDNVQSNKQEVVSNKVNLFDNVSMEDTYSTYYVYIVKEDDTLDSILSRYGVSKEELEKYNDLSEIKPFDKIIIPSCNE